MQLLTSFFIPVTIILYWQSAIILGQRDFVNPAISDPAPCSCDVRANNCDPNCCCDQDCDDNDLAVAPSCDSRRTTSNVLNVDNAFQRWNCSNTTTAAELDYFPFVCVQFVMNENAGKFHPTRNIPFFRSNTEASNLRSIFVSQNPELFRSLTVTSSNTRYSGRSSPVRLSVTGAILNLPGSLTGPVCQENTPVLFGVNRDVTCPSNAFNTPLCERIRDIPSIRTDGQSESSIARRFFTKTYAAPATPPTNSTREYYFETTPPTVDSIPVQNISINDFCSGRHPTNRTQRYFFCASFTGCIDRYRTFNGCPSRPSLNRYSDIPSNFFRASSASNDDATNFADFVNATNTSALNCTTNIRRVFFRFNYSSSDNTISSLEVFVLIDSSATSSTNQRITIEWNDVSINPSLASTVPRGYAEGEPLHFRRNGGPSDIATLAPAADRLCVSGTRQILRYKRDTSSTCFVQMFRSTIEQCHNLKLNMYLYLNTFLAPAAEVLTFPNANATLITLRDDTQESLDLDRIDVTRPNNRLSETTIARTESNTSRSVIYDTSRDLSVCFDVPSGLYIEFGYVRVRISPTVSYERIVTVKFNHTFSNWRFECLQSSCLDTSTDLFPVTLQVAYVDYTNQAFYLGDSTRADLTYADNYIQHLLWMISPEYKGEPGFRNYTIAMILVFMLICVIVMHILLFGLMFPF